MEKHTCIVSVTLDEGLSIILGCWQVSLDCNQVIFFAGIRVVSFACASSETHSAFSLSTRLEGKLGWMVRSTEFVVFDEARVTYSYMSLQFGLRVSSS